MGCMLCGNTEFRRCYAKSGYDICTCLSCNLTQLHPLPPFEMGADIYSDSYFSGTDNAVEGRADLVSTPVVSLGPGVFDVLEVEKSV